MPFCPTCQFFFRRHAACPQSQNVQKNQGCKSPVINHDRRAHAIFAGKTAIFSAEQAPVLTTIMKISRFGTVALLWRCRGAGAAAPRQISKLKRLEFFS